MTLLVEMPDTRSAERDYIIGVLVGDFLGVQWKRVAAIRNDVRITLSGTDGEIILPDVLFSTLPPDWLQSASMPETPIKHWTVDTLKVRKTLTTKRLPVIYGDKFPQAIRVGNKIRLPLDIFGSAFFMLSRYEEYVQPQRDSHDRFPASATLGVKEGFHEQPIVNEYLEVLWACIAELWPQLPRRQRSYRLLLSHDVDNPLSVHFSSKTQIARAVAGDLLARRDGDLFLRRCRAVADGMFSKYDRDPFNTFDFIMDASESLNVASSFYFISGGQGPRDGPYSMTMPWIEKLLRRIAERGHEVGLHPSYQTYRDGVKLKQEFDTLLKAAGRCGIRQNAWGGRQHYLRFDASITFGLYENVGLQYDSSLGFPETTGFRSGCCYEHSVFDLLRGGPLKLKERPLIVMEKALFQPSVSKGVEELKESKFEKYVALCKFYSGDFTLLWHNSKLESKADQATYLNCLAIAGR